MSTSVLFEGYIGYAAYAIMRAFGIVMLMILSF